MSRNVLKHEPKFDIDLVYGRQGELQIGQFLEWVAQGDGHVEVKTKRYLDHKIYVETHHDPGRTETFTLSGISTTAAEMWVYVVAETGIHMAIPTALLREMLVDSSSRDRSEDHGSCPTKGRLVDFCVLLFRQKQKQRMSGR